MVLGTAAALDRPEGLAMMDATHLAILSMDAVLVYTLPGGTPLAATASHRARATQAAHPAAKSKLH
jgi:hypothetical protein